MRRRGSFFAGSFASRSMIESGIFQPRSALALGENRLYAVLMAKIAYIGLGIMGAPMAGHLVRAGHDVTVFNRSMAKKIGRASCRERVVQYGEMSVDAVSLKKKKIKINIEKT